MQLALNVVSHEEKKTHTVDLPPQSQRVSAFALPWVRGTLRHGPFAHQLYSLTEVA